MRSPGFRSFFPRSFSRPSPDRLSPGRSPDRANPTQADRPLSGTGRGRGRLARWQIWVLAGMMALGLVLANPARSVATDWFDLLRRGFEIYQVSNISDRQEVDLGQAIDRELRNQMPIVDQSSLTDWLDRVGQRLARGTQRPELPYRFRLVNNRQVNAFTTMGGFVYVNTGLLAIADSEAEVAGVLAHELGHLDGRHGVKKLQQRAIQQGILSAAGLRRNQAIQLGVELALSRPNSRQDELAADELGLGIVDRAGYALIGLPRFLQRLMNQAEPPTILSTHPSTADRVERLLSKIPADRANQGDGLDPQAYRWVKDQLR